MDQFILKAIFHVVHKPQARDGQRAKEMYVERKLTDKMSNATQQQIEKNVGSSGVNE